MHRGLEPIQIDRRTDGEAPQLLSKAGLRSSGLNGHKFSTFRGHEQLEPDFTDGRVKRRQRPNPLGEEPGLPTSKPKRRHRGGIYNDNDISCAEASKLLGTYLAAMTVLFTTVFVVFYFVHDLMFKYSPWARGKGSV